MSISTLTSAERWKNHGLIGEVQQKFEDQIERNDMFAMDDDQQIDYAWNQATTKKAKATLKKLSGLYAVLNEIQGLNSVATADMLTEDIYKKCKKNYGISKKELQRLINDAQNGLVPQLQYESKRDGLKLGQGEHYFSVEAAQKRMHAEDDNGEQKKNKVTIHQNMEGEFDGIWKTEAEMDASSFINKIRSEKKETRKNGIAFIEERVARLREEQSVRPFQKVTLTQDDIVQCKKEYDLSKKEVEKIAIEIQSKTRAATLENNAEQDEVTEAAEVNVAEVNAEEVNAQAVNAEEVNAQAVNAEEVNAEEVNAQAVNAEEVNAQEVNATEANAQEVNATEANAQAVNAQGVNATEANAQAVNAEEVAAEEAMIKQDIDIKHFDAERFIERQETKGYTWIRTIGTYMMKEIGDTAPREEFLAKCKEIMATLIKQYRLTDEHLRGRYKIANKKREDLELLVQGTTPQDIQEEYRLKELKLTSINGQKRMFEKAKKRLLNGAIISGMTSRQFYDMHQYKKSSDSLAREQKKLSEMQALFEKRSQHYEEKRRENGGIAIPDTEKSIFEAQEKVRALENSVVRLRGIAEKRKKAFEKHETYGEFSLEDINKIYLRCGAEKVRQVAERAESVEVTMREHEKFMKDYTAAVVNRKNAVAKEYENYSKDKKKAEFEKARKEAEAVENARQRNQDDYYVALYMCAELRDARR